MKYLILGNGPTGVIAAETLRQADPHGEIVMAGSEPEPPYSRMAIPYLLEGNIAESGTYLRKTANHFESLKITQRAGQAVAVDAAAKSVRFQDGATESYDQLLIATGSKPIRPPIPGMDLPNVQTCWTLQDARNIAKYAKPGSRVLQLGAGFIGCIIMESLAKRGVKLTVVERGDRMVPRMMTPKAGGMIKEWVESKGIRVVTSAGVERIDPVMSAPAAAPAPAPAEPASGGGLLSKIASIFGASPAPAPAPAPAAPAPQPTGELTVKLSTGEQIVVDLVIVAAGVAPNVAFLKDTGVKVGSGVVVNDRMQTAVDGIYAAGDVAEAPDMFTGQHVVSAIQPNAADQARIAALNMAGKSTQLPGVLAINVLDTLGMISASFGQWWGAETPDGVEQVEAKYHRYISLQFDGEVLIGATAIGLTQHVGVLRGLIQNRTPLGPWKAILQKEPMRFPEAYVAMSQRSVALTGR